VENFDISSSGYDMMKKGTVVFQKAATYRLKGKDGDA